MFKCEDCGTVFQTPDRYRENMGEFWGTPAYEDYPVCPACKSEEIYEVNTCICGEFCEAGETYCNDCKEMIIGRLNAIMYDFKIKPVDLADIVEEL